MAREVLEYVRLRISILVGISPCEKKEVSINGFSCWVSFEEEMSIPDLKLRSFFSKWGDQSESETVASSEDVGGRGRLASVGSYSNEEYKRREGKEITVQCKAAQVEPILGRPNKNDPLIQ